MSDFTPTPLRVTFFDGAHFSLYDHKTKKLDSSLGDSGNKDVTEFIQEVRWTFSTKSPYEQINITMNLPVGELLTTLPSSRKKITTGFWVTIHSEDSKVDTEKFGKLLCWGRVSTLNLSRRADQRTGAVTAKVSLTADSWVHYLDQNMQILTENSKNPDSSIVEYPNKSGFKVGTSRVRDVQNAVKQKWKDVTITGTEYVNFKEGLRTSSLGEGDDFFGEDKEDIGVSEYAYGDVLVNSSLGKSAASVYHKFAKNTFLPPSLQKDLNGKLKTDNKINFSNLIAFVFDGKSYLHSTDTITSVAANDLSRFGFHDSIPMGTGSKLIIDHKSGFGIWTAIRRSYDLDPNLVEMFPTLIEVAVDEQSIKMPGHNLFARKDAKDYIFYAQNTALPGSESFKFMQESNPSDSTLEDIPFIFGVYRAKVEGSPKRKGLKDDTGESYISEFEGETIPKRMIPVIMYRLKPTNSPAAVHSGFITNYHNQQYVENYGDGFLPYTPAGYGQNYQTLAAAGKFPHFSRTNLVNQYFEQSPYQIKSHEIVEFSASLSDNKRIVATCVSTQATERLPAGLGFSSLRELVIDAPGFMDYGFRFYEFNFGLNVGSDLVKGNFNIIRALNEYGSYLLKREAEGLMGKLTLNIRPEIRAGMWLTVEFEEEGSVAAMYVEGVTHFMRVAANGTVNSLTEVNFSMMEYFSEKGAFALVGDVPVSG
jgi:hypothetical protein